VPDGDTLDVTDAVVVVAAAELPRGLLIWMWQMRMHARIKNLDHGYFDKLRILRNSGPYMRHIARIEPVGCLFSI